MKNNEYVNRFCVGCGLCDSAKGVHLVKDEKGFPTVQIAPDEYEEWFSNICPVYYYKSDYSYNVWGDVKKAVVGYSANPDIRFKASSGGALTELCVYLLESGKVDGIIHTTYNPNKPTETISCISYTAKEVKKRCGSRYSISVPLSDILEMIDENDKRYAFVGKPCDVMALRRFFKTKSSLADRILYLISFFCAGEPSVDAQKMLLEAMGTTVENCGDITYRGNGWPGYTTVNTKDGKELKIEYKNAWGKYLGRDLRYVCRFCLDGTGDCADIVCADFWHLDEKGYPDFSEHNGRNIILARNEKGVDLLDGAINAGKLKMETDFTNRMNEFYKYQPHQYNRKCTMNSTIKAMKLFLKPVPKYNKSLLKKYGKNVSFSIRYNYFIGIVKRIIKGRI